MKNNKNTKNAKKITKTQKAQAQTSVAPVSATETATATTIEVTPAAPAPVVAKTETRGRKPGSPSQSVVSLRALINALPENSSILLPNPYIRRLTKLGLNLSPIPFKVSPKALTEVINTCQKPVIESKAGEIAATV